MDYRVVFAVTQTSPDWRPTAFGLIFVGVGLLLWRYRQSAADRHRAPPVVTKMFAGTFLVFALAWTVVVTVGRLVSYRRAVDALRERRARVVEGLVEDFDPMPAGGHRDESFTVQGVHFAYSDYKLIPGFHNAASHGGPIREGLPVRIHYSGLPSKAMILELEIKAQ